MGRGGGRVGDNSARPLISGTIVDRQLKELRTDITVIDIKLY